MMNKRQEISEEIKEELAADGSLSGVESEFEEEPLEPFDPEQISISPKPVTMETILRRLQQGTIRLAPAFQRKLVWDKTRKSRLIESLMLNIPLPVFYVAADEKENWDVVDGLQRLTTLKEFILGENYIKTRNKKDKGEGFPLTALEFWGNEFNNKKFKDLPPLMENRILEAEFTFIIINPGTPEEVKRNIFKRINTGGMPLTAQEIRHALYQGKATTLLEELVNTEEFKKATGNKVNDSRMAAREIILRFLAFLIMEYRQYPKSSDMDKFLSNTMRLINLIHDCEKRSELWQPGMQKIFKNDPIPQIKIISIETMKTSFLSAMIRAEQLFGDHAFRKSYSGKNRAPINRTLFEMWGNILTKLSKEQFETLINNKNDFLKAYQKILIDKQFGNDISRDSWKHYRVRKRYEILESLTEKYIEVKDVK